jgi:hypothetical protein
MKKGLLLTLLAGAIALFGLVSSAYAGAPVVLQIPDIIVGDEEGNLTMDKNIFEFPDALNLVDFVLDPNTPSEDILWTFEAETTTVEPITATTVYSVNGLQVGDAGADDLTDRGGSADSTWVSFTNELTAGIDPGSNEYIRALTFYASDGDLEDSGTFLIQIADGGYDDRTLTYDSAVDSYDFASDAEGWDFYTIEGFGSPSSSTSGGAISIDAASTDQYCIWQAPSGSLEYVDNSVYKVTWNLSTDQANPEQVPGIRLMVQTQSFLCTGYMTVLGSASGNCLGTTAKDVVTYFACPDLSALDGTDYADLYIEMDLLSFQGAINPNGVISLNDVTVDRFNANAITDDNDLEITTFAEVGEGGIWSQTYAEGVYSVPTLAVEDDKLTLQSGGPATTGGFYYGGYEGDIGPALVADQLYKVRAVLQSDNTVEPDLTDLPKFRIMVASNDVARNNSVMEWKAYDDVFGTGVAIDTTVPTADGDSFFDVFLQPLTPTAGFSGEELKFTIEIVDSEDGQQGKYIVREIRVQEMEPIVP